ncbi:MAG: lipoate--protein ligase family protein [Candidatus Omnitrophota bacterium]
MQIVEDFAENPEEKIALDELLLDKAERGEVGETLRFWSSNKYFIVVGRSGKVSEECYVKLCRDENVKIIRRVSGGGTVLQGPGCLNWSAVISYARNEKYRNINGSYRSILEPVTNRLKEKGFNVSFFPISDIALNEKKISGNAQARKRKYFLHHGTFLLDFDLDKVSHYLQYPPKEPDYRQKRGHKDFLANIYISCEELKEIIMKTFCVFENIWRPSEKDMLELKGYAEKKYLNVDWNYAF